MTDKYRPEPTEQEANKRAKEYLDKIRKKYPVAPVNENEPSGLLAGDPEKLNARIKSGEDFEDYFDEDENDKPDLKIVKKSDSPKP